MSNLDKYVKTIYNSRMSQRNEYSINLIINGLFLTRVVVDQHYQINHPDMNDKLILNLVKELDNGNFAIREQKGNFQYFTVEPIELDNKPYRLVLLLCIHDDFLGVINAFRVKRRKS